MTAPRPRPAPPAGPRPRVGLVLAFLVVAVATMVPFEGTLTRVVGVLALFGFIVSGVFAIAAPAFLDPAADEEPKASSGPDRG